MTGQLTPNSIGAKSKDLCLPPIEGRWATCHMIKITPFQTRTRERWTSFWQRCFGLTEFTTGSLFQLPLPIPILLPTRSTDAVMYLGERYDPNWTIRRCLSCRQGHLLNFEAPFPQLTPKNQLSKILLYRKYPCMQLVQGLSDLRHGEIDEIDAIRCMRWQFGGDVGVKAYNVSTKGCDEDREARIRWYQLQQWRPLLQITCSPLFINKCFSLSKNNMFFRVFDIPEGYTNGLWKR